MASSSSACGDEGPILLPMPSITDAFCEAHELLLLDLQRLTKKYNDLLTLLHNKPDHPGGNLYFIMVEGELAAARLAELSYLQNSGAYYSEYLKRMEKFATAKEFEKYLKPVNSNRHVRNEEGKWPMNDNVADWIQAGVQPDNHQYPSDFDEPIGNDINKPNKCSIGSFHR